MAGVALGAGLLVGAAAPSALAAPAAPVVFPLDGAHPDAHWVAVRTAPAAAVPASPGGIATPHVVMPRVGNVAYQGQVCHTDNIDEVTGAGPITLTLSNTRAVASQWSATASISPAAVSAGVGFNVTTTNTNTEGGAYTVPAGKWGGIIAHPLYDNFSFTTYGTLGQPTGNGTALHPVGFCYETFAN